MKLEKLGRRVRGRRGKGEIKEVSWRITFGEQKRRERCSTEEIK